MLIKTLIENKTISEDFAGEHGLSLYIETDGQKILFDVGASDLFLQNAKKLEVNIANVDFLVISHGHYDHGGGLKTFFKENTKAKVYLHQLAFGKYYADRGNGKLAFIGIDKELEKNKQIIPTSDNFSISDKVRTFANVAQKEALPVSNSGLLMEQNGQIMQDTFAHEQNLIIEENGKTLLITGCAHNGIINILEHFQTLEGRMPDCVIGGFHLSGRSGGSEDSETLDKIAKYLLGTGAKFYTGHCTGIEPYERLKFLMGERIDYLATGSEITV